MSYNKYMKEKCIKIWEHLEKTGGSSKGIAYMELGLEPDEFSCPACAIDREFGKGDCTSCPMYGKWKTVYAEYARCCIGNDTHFKIWSYANNKSVRKNQAGIIKRNIINDWPDDLNLGETE